ncbi:hypothetical protein [Vibrio sp. WXL103]|uniref:hypothetical protein n=1 Tax=unclassified Vibrio TaxID=2614977 RepID=UPI003EC76C78
MKFICVLVCLALFGISSIEHSEAFAAGSIVALLSLGACYWIAFQPTSMPQFAMGMLFLGLLAKLVITSLGLSLTFMANLASSPLIAILAYLYTSIAACIYWYRKRNHRAQLNAA